jgi:two-component system sensor histidine kinase YesM
MDIDAELLPMRTVKLILQPLVENAIYYGRRENGQPLNITIYSFYNEKVYSLVVEDDGNGILLERIKDIYEGSLVSSHSGYGLRNVIERVKMCSNNKGEVIIESTPNEWTHIIINQPLTKPDVCETACANITR